MKTIVSLMACAIALSCVNAVAAAEGVLLPLIATFENAAWAADRPAPRWELRRGVNCVVAIDEASGVAERWMRDPDGRLSYQRVFPDAAKIIEYQPVDLALGGVEDEWARIASVIDPQELGELNLLSEPMETQLGRAIVYRGSRKGAQWEVQWLAAIGIPARIQIERAGGASTLVLVHLERPDKGDLVCELPGARSYEYIDFADLGDRHGDPFIDRLMHQDGLFSGHRY